MVIRKEITHKNHKSRKMGLKFVEDIQTKNLIQTPVKRSFKKLNNNFAQLNENKC
jgi:hypothetical protein